MADELVFRPAHELVVFCSRACRWAFRTGRRRMRRRHPTLRSYRRYRETLLNLPPPRGPDLGGSNLSDTLTPDEHTSDA